MKKPKLPKAALNDLIDVCELLGKMEGKPPNDVFRQFLALIEKYAAYFFKDPWPDEYNFETATTFTPEDRTFLVENPAEHAGRLTIVCLKKSTYLGGIMLFGLMWTQDAYDREFTEPDQPPPQS